MKTIGLIGGMSWESTLSYYRLINQAVNARLGGLHSASLVLHSVDFAAIDEMQRADDWDAAGAQLAQAARGLQAAGAGALLICANTMHKVAPAIESAVQIPLLHVVDATAAAVRQAGVRRVGLLGTRFTMEQSFYVERLQQQGLDVLLPDADGRATVHQVIYQELCQGVLLEDSREAYRRVMAALVAQGAEGIILGCTEIALLVGASDATVPLFDTTRLHAQAAVDWALADA
jgi:aspartate racemase